MRTFTLSALLALAPTAALATWSEAQGKTLDLETVTGFFLQDEADTDPDSFDYADHNFGLVEREYPTDASFDPSGSKTQWERFAHYVDYLNNNCQKDDDVKYKVLLFGRHGQGFHNVAESYYGTPAWNCYWAEKTGNGTITWEDPLLTDAGFAEAYKANDYFASRYASHGMPYFDSYYSSPLTRCLQTANATFATLALPDSAAPFVPTIKELFREGISIHTCDHRSTRSQIHELVPDWAFEPGFTEQDELWRGDADEGETAAHQVERSHEVLADVFRGDDGTWISVTSHSGEISKLMVALKHREFHLSTGQIIPVLVRAKVEEAGEPKPTSTIVGFTSEATCNAPPVTSISGQGCVCSGSGSSSSTLASVSATATAA